MLKHFVGEGSNEGGRDDHSDSGKWNVFPGSNFNAHLVPFLDGGFKLDSKTKAAVAVMPCYGIAYDPNDPDELGETVGSAYSAHNMSILRNTGWDGWICTDWMILSGIMHGCKDLTKPERWAKLMKNTVCSIGGEWDIDDATAGYKLLVDDMGADSALALLQDNARRFIKAEMTVDLFEQPYSDRSAAKEVLESKAAAAFGIEAAEKSVVMIAILYVFTMLYLPIFAFTSSMAQTWNADLIEQVGQAVGEEALASGYSGWYAPACDTHRSPFAGRNFEYFSEDPVLGGTICAAEIQGAASRGCYAYVKHFALNDQESYRIQHVMTWATEQTMRECYLRQFEIAVKRPSVDMKYISDDQGTMSTKKMPGCTGVMSSFNYVGTEWAGGRKSLLTGLLRDEWGFRGAVITDFNLYGYMLERSDVRDVIVPVVSRIVGPRELVYVESSLANQAIARADRAKVPQPAPQPTTRPTVSPQPTPAPAQSYPMP